MAHSLLALLCLTITILAGCGPTRFGSSWGTPTPTPPQGFFNVDSLLSGQHLYTPRLSADGKYLAALGSTIPQNSIPRLYVVDLENKEVLYTGVEELWYWLDISPDGSVVAVSGTPGSKQSVYLVDWKRERVSYLLDGTSPSWLPTGQQLAYVRITGESFLEYRREIMIHDIVTSSENPVFNVLSPTYNFGYLTWDWVGDQFAFVWATEKVQSTGNISIAKNDLFVFSKDNGELRKLTNSIQFAHSPNFLPDGSKILYLDTSAPPLVNNYLHVVNLEGECHRLESPIPGQIWEVNLSAQGNVVAFYGQYGLWVAETEVALGDSFWDKGIPCPQE